MNHMKQTRVRSISPRAEGILRELVGPKREIPTLGMIAAGTNYSRSHICYILLGRRHGTAACIRAVAGYLGVTMEALMTALERPKIVPATHRSPRPRTVKVEKRERAQDRKQGLSALARLKAKAAASRAPRRARS